MKARTLLSIAVLAIVALALTAPAVGQSIGGHSWSITWRTGLHGDTARTYGTAEYVTFKASIAPPPALGKLINRFMVETVTPDLADGITLDVFMGPSTNPAEPYGKLVGIIDVDGGVGTMVLIGAKTPSVHDGTTVVVVDHQPTPGGERVLLKGTF